MQYFDRLDQWTIFVLLNEKHDELNETLEISQPLYITSIMPANDPGGNSISLEISTVMSCILKHKDRFFNS